VDEKEHEVHINFSVPNTCIFLYNANFWLLYPLNINYWKKSFKNLEMWCSSFATYCSL